jgi:hypothetical protein
MLVDATTGDRILRETTFVEFLDENYFRVYVQDFLVGIVLHQPLFPPVLIVEGPLLQQSTNTMMGGEVLRSRGSLVSKNKKYCTATYFKIAG